MDLSDSEDSPDGAEANEQCDGILGNISWTSFVTIVLHPTSVPLDTFLYLLQIKRSWITTTIRTPMSMTAMTLFPIQSCLLAKGGLGSKYTHLSFPTYLMHRRLRPTKETAGMQIATTQDTWMTRLSNFSTK